MFRFATICALVAGPAHAAQDLADFLGDFRQEVVAEGWLGISHDGVATFWADGHESRMPAQIALDRDMVRQISDQCQVGPVAMGNAGMCRATIGAELFFSGPIASLLIYQVDDLTPPEVASDASPLGAALADALK